MVNPEISKQFKLIETYITGSNPKGIGFIDDRLADILSDIPREDFSSLIELGKAADLAIVVGGDGNMLGAARVLSRFKISVIGVNRGSLGFLTDLNPEDFHATLKNVLDGEFIVEERFLLEAEVHRHGQVKVTMQH